MAENVTPRVRAPREASAGEVVSVRTLISHPMESGMRRDGDGNTIPRSTINRFVCTFNGETVVDVTMEPSIATNPYFQFEAKVTDAAFRPNDCFAQGAKFVKFCLCAKVAIAQQCSERLV